MRRPTNAVSRLTVDQLTFPLRLNEQQSIRVIPFLGTPQYYLYMGNKLLRLLDPEEVEEMAAYL